MANNRLCISGGTGSFGGQAGTASGIFENCKGENGSFGGADGTASGTFINCKGAAGCFGGMGGTASGTFTDCTGGGASFGGGPGGKISSTARLYYCRLTSGTFGTPQAGGKLVLCIDGTNSIVTTT